MSQIQTPPMMAPEAPQPDTSVRDFTKMWVGVGSDLDYMRDRGHVTPWEHGEKYGIPDAVQSDDNALGKHAKQHADVYAKWLKKNHPELDNATVDNARSLMERETFDRARGTLLQHVIDQGHAMQKQGADPTQGLAGTEWLPFAGKGGKTLLAQHQKVAGENFQHDAATPEDYRMLAFKHLWGEREQQRAEGGWGQQAINTARGIGPTVGEVTMMPGSLLKGGFETGAKLAGNMPVLSKLAGAAGAGGVFTALDPLPAITANYERQTPKVAFNERGGLDVEGGESAASSVVKSLASEWLDNSAMMLAGPWFKGRGKGALSMIYRSAQAGPTGLAAIEGNAELKKTLGLAPEGSDFRSLASDDPNVRSAAWKRILLQTGAFTALHGGHEAAGSLMAGAEQAADAAEARGREQDPKKLAETLKEHLDERLNEAPQANGVPQHPVGPEAAGGPPAPTNGQIRPPGRAEIPPEAQESQAPQTEAPQAAQPGPQAAQPGVPAEPVRGTEGAADNPALRAEAGAEPGAAGQPTVAPAPEVPAGEPGVLEAPESPVQALGGQKPSPAPPTQPEGQAQLANGIPEAPKAKNGMRRKGGPDLDILAQIRAEKEAKAKAAPKLTTPEQQLQDFQQSKEFKALSEPQQEKAFRDMQEALGVGEYNPADYRQEGPTRSRILGMQHEANRRLAGPGLLTFNPESVQAIKDATAKTVDAFKVALAPASRGPEAKIGAGILRQNLAILAHKTELAADALHQGKAYLDKFIASSDPKVRTDRFLQFTDAVEHGTTTDLPPEMKPIAEAIRQLTDEREAKLEHHGLVKDFIENYMGHIWQKPGSKATPDQIGQMLGARRPMAGSEAFRRGRKLPTYRDGIELGLEPASWNPVELALTKLREMDKSIMAHDSVEELKSQNLWNFMKLGKNAPEGWRKIDDRLARVFAPPSAVEGAFGPMLTGHYYTPEPIAKLMDNYLSPGLRGNALFDAARGAGNLMNQFDLGFSAYHGGFVTLDSAISSVALGLQQTSRGDVLKGAGSILKTPASPFLTFLQGNKMLKEYYSPGSQGAETAALVDALEKGGGRAKMDSFYGGEHVEAFRSALRQFRAGDASKAKSALWHAVPALAEIASKPIMEYYVPRMKLGVFADMARYELSKLPPDATPNQAREVLGKAWDSVDNRMGQMTYDNIFWNRTGKDLAMLSVRSVGWNVGTIREVGGGIKDIPSSASGIFQGKGISPRLAYAAALPLTVGFVGAMMHYLMTGKPPEELKDYFFPKTGRKLDDGTDDRLSLPSYMKDLAHLSNRGGEGPMRISQNAAEMAKGKLHPLLTTIGDILSNKDFFDQPIRQPSDPANQQMQDSLVHFLKAFEPYSLRQPKRQQLTPAEKAAQFIGVTPAPAYIRRTDKELLERDSPEANARRDFGKGIREMRELGIKPMRNGMRR